ncbi:MAG: hypothetical protein SW833_28740 [Cyanobacteriota bacterium]|nr:hypothetical protein [Cyanobacteriota bacterium]
MSNYDVLCQIVLSNRHHQPTVKTQHFRGTEKIPAPHSLQIVKYPNDFGYYLLYLDEQGEELTDTYHEQLDGAVAQAEWEFSVRPEQWTVIKGEKNENMMTETEDSHTEGHNESESSLLAKRLREKLKNTSQQ